MLERAGYRYSSSLYPARFIPEAPQFAFHPLPESRFMEIPVASVQRFGMSLPSGGGGYFRLFPYSLFKRNLRAVRSEDRQPCMFYFHPWEIDHTQPRITGTSVKTRVRHYLNLDRTFDRLQMLLKDFRWSSAERVFFADSTPTQ
jgi:polysaccharide deacetylase family protein (PEP-CTERM system associated)